MASLTLTGLQATGSIVSAQMFGANAVFEDTDAGRPTAAYQSAADTLGVENIRFGGGQADLDPNKTNAAGARPVDGESAINIVTMPGGALRAELVDFLDWCVARNVAGQPTQTTLIIPTKHLSAEAYAGFAPQIETFVKTVMQDYGDVIAAFQIGNEYWEMGETAYGTKASLAAEAIAEGLRAAGVADANQPDILVQMGTAGNQGSEFPATPGVSDFIARNTAANNQIIDQLSDRAIAAIDGVTEHYYYNGSNEDFSTLGTSVRNIDRDYAIWTERLGTALDLYITEWNVKTSAQTLHGMVAGVSMVKQFENMIALGVDGAHVWALDYHSRTALTLDTDAGARLDGQGRLTNAPQGAVFDLMSEALVGKTLVSASFEGAVPGISITSYGDAQEMVFYVASHRLETTALSLDLAAGLEQAGPARAVQVTMDPASSNGRQWVNGVAADSVEIDGQPYYYNEHDVDVLLKDLIFADPGQIALTLKPFEVVALTVPLGQTPLGPVGPAPAPAGQMIATRPGDERVEGGAGKDTAVFTGLQDAYTLVVSPEGMTLIDRRPAEDGTDELVGIEQLQFADGTFDIDSRAGALEASQADLAAIVELYIAYFDRAPAAKGLLYWANRLEEGMALEEIAESFFVQPETQATYAAFLDGAGGVRDTQGFVTAVFNNVLGRDPTSAYWTGELARNPDVTPATFVLAVLNGAKAATGGAQDRAFLETKTNIGVYFSAVKGLSDYDDTIEVMEIYDGSAASLGKALSHIDALYADARDPDEGSFLIELVGVIDDPFAGG